MIVVSTSPSTNARKVARGSVSSGTASARSVALTRFWPSPNTASRNKSYLLAECRYSAGADMPTRAAISSMLTA
ncbi:Uncharacterised protein [Mycobacteroides abscessus subsp. abscessus]|nr:Uncharacterised protein [Mycobacteroides abscessus subsp. abscessus]